MNIPESELAATANRFETLVAQGLYLEAQACFEEYCRNLEVTLRSLPPGDRRLGQMESAWHRLFNQARCQVLAGRAHLATRLARLPQRRRVYSAAPPPPRTWELIG